MKEEQEDKVLITDLLDVIHYTVIKYRGENDVILHELQSINQKIAEGKLANWPVKGITFWESIKNGFPERRAKLKQLHIATGILIGVLVTSIVYIMFST